MKSLNIITVLSTGLIGGGLLTSIPLIVVNCSCNPNSQVQVISGNKELFGGRECVGQEIYTTNANTTPTWSVVADSGITITNNGVLTWSDTLSLGNYEITIKCVASNYSDATCQVVLNIAPTLEINNANVTSYLTPENTPIFIAGTTSHTIGNKLLKLKEFSAVNGNITHYIVTEDISFGFLVDPDMDCQISAKDGITITCNGGTSEAAGVIVGTIDSGCTGVYTKKLVIDPSVTFDVYSASFTYGVYFCNTAAGSIQTINGTFTIATTNSSHAYGVYFIANASGNATINGTFVISSAYHAYGVYFNIATGGSTQTVNGNFTVHSTNNAAYGVYFDITAVGSIQIINGTFTVSADIYFAYGIYFYDYTSGNITTNGTFTIYSSYGTAYGARGIEFSATTSESVQTINGTFTVFSNFDRGASGVRFYHNVNVEGTFNMTAKFFSNQSPSIESLWPNNSNVDSSWNGIDFDDNFNNGSLRADSTLGIEDINDSDAANFVIKVMKTSDFGSKDIFNDIYRTKLTKYLNGIGYQTTGTTWLQNILNKEW